MLELLVLLNLMQLMLILTLLILLLTNPPHIKEQTQNRRHLMEQRLHAKNPAMFPDPNKTHRLRQRWNDAVQTVIAAQRDEQNWQ